MDHLNRESQEKEDKLAKGITSVHKLKHIKLLQGHSLQEDQPEKSNEGHLLCKWAQGSLT